METRRRIALVWRWSLVSGALIALFWSCWYLLVKSVPCEVIPIYKSQIQSSLPFIPRWFDILIGPIWSVTLVLMFTSKTGQNDIGRMISGLITGLAIGTLLALFFLLFFPSGGKTIDFCLCFGGVFAFVSGVAFYPEMIKGKFLEEKDKTFPILNMESLSISWYFSILFIFI